MRLFCTIACDTCLQAVAHTDWTFRIFTPSSRLQRIRPATSEPFRKSNMRLSIAVSQVTYLGETAAVISHGAPSAVQRVVTKILCQKVQVSESATCKARYRILCSLTNTFDISLSAHVWSSNNLEVDCDPISNTFVPTLKPNNSDVKQDRDLGCVFSWIQISTY